MASDFNIYRNDLIKEFEAYYRGCPYSLDEEQKVLDERLQLLVTSYPFEKKAVVYQGAAELCRVKVFRNSPFFFELISGRERNSSQNGYPPGPGLEGWYLRKHVEDLKPFQRWMRPYKEIDMVWGDLFTDLAHHTVGYDNVLKKGMRGMKKEAEKKLTSHCDELAKSFYRSVITACDALCSIAKRFSDEAGRLLEHEENKAYKENLQMVQTAALHVPYYPADSFYEALCSILFVKEMAMDLEGVAVAVLGHLDRLLWPYYEKDVALGRLTYEEAKNLMAHWLVHVDARWDLMGDEFASTNASTVIGGCEKDGATIFNDVTRMILECYEEYEFVNPKIQARVSEQHPAEYFERCSRMIASGRNVFSFLNDDVIIHANVKMGKKLEDARLYSAGGCQEPILDNKEMNCRAFCYISLPQIVNALWDETLNVGCLESTIRQKYDSFEEVYDNYFEKLSLLYQNLVQVINQGEKKLADFNACPLISCTMDDCLDRGRDMTQGGAVYNPTSLPLVGIGTAIDSLLAIQEVVFDKKMLTFEELGEILKNNFETDFRIGEYLKNLCPKYGEDSDKVNKLAVRFFKDAAKKTSGYMNERGGQYEASLFVFYLFDWMREHVMATPDGRQKTLALSRGMNPTEQSGMNNIANILHTVSEIDLTDFPGAGVLYLEMPLAKTTDFPKQIADTIKGFLRAGGSALDLNILDREVLKAAKIHPEKYSNIVVRVCGFSAYFTSLEPHIQDEIIGRTFMNE